MPDTVVLHIQYNTLIVFCQSEKRFIFALDRGIFFVYNKECVKAMMKRSSCFADSRELPCGARQYEADDEVASELHG